MQDNTKAVLAIVLMCLICGDILLNASVEYDQFAGGTKSQTGVIMYLALQLMSLIMVFIMSNSTTQFVSVNFAEFLLENANNGNEILSVLDDIVEGADTAL